VYHVLNRSVGRIHTFGKAADLDAFDRVMVEAHQREPIRILAYFILPDHWHFVVWPERDGQPRSRIRCEPKLIGDRLGVYRENVNRLETHVLVLCHS
jgi:REP element-mobilizing transposase RayT